MSRVLPQTEDFHACGVWTTRKLLQPVASIFDPFCGTGTILYGVNPKNETVS